MDLIRLLRSLEEFLYELVGWLVFFPRTFWRVLRHPGRIARYTHEELQKDPAQRFEATISPVLMLILSVTLAHALEMVFRVDTPRLNSPVGQLLFGSEQGLLLTRSAVFCVYALGAALGSLRRQRAPVTRETLREPFSIQAFLACPFVILLAIAQLLTHVRQPWTPGLSVAVGVAGVLWYLAARVIAHRSLHGGGVINVAGRVLASFLLTGVVIVGFMALLIA